MNTGRKRSTLPAGLGMDGGKIYPKGKQKKGRGKRGQKTLNLKRTNVAKNRIKNPERGGKGCTHWKIHKGRKE